MGRGPSGVGPGWLGLGLGGRAGGGAFGLGCLPGREGRCCCRLQPVCRLLLNYRLQGWMTSQDGGHPLLGETPGSPEARLLRGQGPGMAGRGWVSAGLWGTSPPPTPASCPWGQAGVGGWEEALGAEGRPGVWGCGLNSGSARGSGDASQRWESRVSLVGFYRGTCACPQLCGVCFEFRGLHVPNPGPLWPPSFTDNEAEGSRCGGLCPGSLQYDPVKAMTHLWGMLAPSGGSEDRLMEWGGEAQHRLAPLRILS